MPQTPEKEGGIGSSPSSQQRHSNPNDPNVFTRRRTTFTETTQFQASPSNAAPQNRVLPRTDEQPFRLPSSPPTMPTQWNSISSNQAINFGSMPPMAPGPSNSSRSSQHIQTSSQNSTNPSMSGVMLVAPISYRDPNGSGGIIRFPSAPPPPTTTTTTTRPHRAKNSSARANARRAAASARTVVLALPAPHHYPNHSRMRGIRETGTSDPVSVTVAFPPPTTHSSGSTPQAAAIKASAVTVVSSPPPVTECEAAPVPQAVVVGSSSRSGAVDPVGATVVENLPMKETASSGGESEIDVEICETLDAFYFRVPVPGVERVAGRFGCEIEMSGKVRIHGQVKPINKRIRRNCDEGTQYVQSDEHFKPVGDTIFKPGPFEHSFLLPGLVDPRKFTGHFSDDGIFEAFVMKYKED
ncbi:hypothetical protein QJS10_CPB19g00959 [Acorus calamus]|uniref:Uncharacterized protein n=1 Tax=Acorus calamus TaxID=4465 RepID=A0AAV9CKU5_ACOCL|nr:hypothetical protein QJS10_CPB19g00959 [Acorus calamus]